MISFSKTKSGELDFFILSVSIFWFNGNENHFLRTINMLVLCDTWISTQNSSKFYESCDHPMGGVLKVDVNLCLLKVNYEKCSTKKRYIINIFINKRQLKFRKI